MLYRPRNELFIHISNYAHFVLPERANLPKVSFKKYYDFEKLRLLFGPHKTDKELIQYFMHSKAHHGLITWDEKQIFIHPDSINIYINRRNTMMSLLKDTLEDNKKILKSFAGS